MDENGTPHEPGQVPQPPAMPGEPPATPPPPPPHAAPSPPPAQPGTQPVQYQQPAPGQPPAAPAGQSPPKKKTTAIILIIVAIVLLLCAMTACGIGTFVLIASGPDFEETSEQADIHYDAAYYLVEDNIDYYREEFGDVYDETVDGEGGDAASQYVDILDRANADIAESRNELVEAQLLIDSLSESEFKGRYLDSIATLNLSLDTYGALYSGLPQKTADMASVSVLLDNLEEADDHLYESVRLTNTGEYAEAKDEADAALGAYQDAAAYLEDLSVRYPDLEFDLLVSIERLYAEAAIAAIKAAEAGLSGDNTAYQKHVEEYDTADAELDEAPTPFWFDDWDLLWEEEAAAWDQAWAYAEESWEEREAAWQAANEGNY